MELWGWENNKPYLSATLHEKIQDFTMLLGCLVTATDACDGDASNWVQNVMIPAEMDASTAQLRFTSDPSNPFTSNRISMSFNQAYNWYRQFVYDWINNGSLVTPAGQPFYFNDSLGRYFATQADYYTDNNDCLGDKWCVSNIFGVNRTGKGAFKLFYEVNPLNQENINLAPSNRVYILHDMPAEGIDDFSVPFTPFYPDIYDIQFLEETYKPGHPGRPAAVGLRAVP